MQDWCAELGIQQRFMLVVYHQANRHVEVTNRILVQGIKSKLEHEGGQWVDALPGVLWPYRTTSKSTMRETPFNLVYELEVVIPAEAELEASKSSTMSRKAMITC
ncbi:UNVERIFIED_CONTAM: hypothetical protein Slati_1421300 [Sesamum latifolium]|uniref:Uncharacterized protein n=1 Tax=Sesamum latifolium TaxID=2727402 RepID=A0AAW2X5V9_9LAMI